MNMDRRIGVGHWFRTDRRIQAAFGLGLDRRRFAFGRDLAFGAHYCHVVSFASVTAVGASHA